MGCGLDPDQCVLGIEAGCFFEEIGDPLAELIQNIAERGRPMKIPSELIRKRSYEIWQREGCPNGCDLAHWLRAEAELGAESQRIDVQYANCGHVWPRPPISRPPRKSGHGTSAKTVRRRQRGAQASIERPGRKRKYLPQTSFHRDNGTISGTFNCRRSDEGARSSDRETRHAFEMRIADYPPCQRRNVGPEYQADTQRPIRSKTFCVRGGNLTAGG